MIEGVMRLRLDGKEHLLGPGDEMTTPPGTPHAQLAGGDGEGRVRVTLRPGRPHAGVPRAARRA